MYLNGSTITLSGTSSPGFADGDSSIAQFFSPQGVAVSPDGLYILVADESNNAIRKVMTSSGSVTTVAGGMAGYTDGQGLRAAFNGTTGVAISPDGATAYVADRGNHAIRSIQLATGLVQTLAGAQGTPEAGFQDGPGPSARLNAPWGVAISPDSAWLYVADTLNHAVRRVALPGGDVVTIAGTNASGLADGLSLINGSDASAAPDDQRLDSPRGVAVSPAGDFLVVADTGNHAVRRLEILPGPDADPAGAPTYYAYNLTTIAGNATAGYQDTADGEPLFSGPTRAVVAPCAPAAPAPATSPPAPAPAPAASPPTPAPAPAGIGADSWG
jgi:DNA-binding beta-propeller fold protein YncE